MSFLAGTEATAVISAQISQRGSGAQAGQTEPGWGCGFLLPPGIHSSSLSSSTSQRAKEVTRSSPGQHSTLTGIEAQGALSLEAIPRPQGRCFSVGQLVVNVGMKLKLDLQSVSSLSLPPH